MKKSNLKTVVSNQYIFSANQIVTFLRPNLGKIKGKVLGTDFTAQMGYTVTVLTSEGELLQINERFLQKLVGRAA